MRRPPRLTNTTPSSARGTSRCRRRSSSATRARPGRASRSSRCRLTSARTSNVSGECLMHVDVRLGSRDELREVTGCGFGELPPVGGLFGLPLLFDQDLLAEDELYFNAGSLTASMVVSPRALEALER